MYSCDVLFCFVMNKVLLEIPYGMTLMWSHCNEKTIYKNINNGIMAAINHGLSNRCYTFQMYYTVKNLYILCLSYDNWHIKIVLLFISSMNDNCSYILIIV